jgi:ABC-type sugar transport system substrate-binding protein
VARLLVALLWLAILTAPLAAEAQQAARVPRIGVILPTAPPPAPQPWLNAFREGLRGLGHVEGANDPPRGALDRRCYSGA